MKSVLVLVVAAAALASAVRLPLLPRRYPTMAEIKSTMFASGGTQVGLKGGQDHLNLYYVHVGIGTPVQNLTVQIDTGSSDLLVYGEKCTSCGKATRFDSDRSSTYAEVGCNAAGYTCQYAVGQDCVGSSCGFLDQYGDGSKLAGVVANDIVTVGTLATRATFGSAITGTKGFEPNQVDGIFGVAYQRLSSFEQPNVLQHFSTALGTNNWFSLCLSPAGGEMTIGEPFEDSSFQWTPVIDKAWYVVDVNDFSVNGVTIDAQPTTWQNSQPIIDSGTTLLYLGSDLYELFSKTWTDQCSDHNNWAGICTDDGGLLKGNTVSLTSDDIKSFPNMTVTFRGTAPLIITPLQYLVPADISSTTSTTTHPVGADGDYQLGIQNSGQNKEAGATIFGDVFMQGVVSLFDVSQSRIGFANIDACGNV